MPRGKRNLEQPVEEQAAVEEQVEEKESVQKSKTAEFVYELVFSREVVFPVPVVPGKVISIGDKDAFEKARMSSSCTAWRIRQGKKVVDEFGAWE